MEPSDRDSAKSDDFNLWAVVLTGNNKFIGNPVSDELDENGMLLLSEVYEISVQLIPQPVGPGRIALHREIAAVPFINTLEEGSLWVRPDAVQWMKDLKPGDVNRYKRLVTQARELCVQTRAQESNLAIGRPGNPPGKSFA